MELSFLVAKVISVIYICMGVAVFIGTLNFNELLEDLKKSRSLTFIGGAVGIAVGLVLIEQHNIWILNWTLLITIISWFFLIGGMMMVMFPKVIFSYRVKVTKSWSLLMIGFGLIMGYFGFFA